MKRTFKKMLGVTLLEIMLVLAIAAMVIVMSIRYYSSASSNQRIASYASQLTGIMAGVNSYVQGGNPLGSATNATVATYLPGNSVPVSPWGSSITIAGSTAAGNFTVTLSTAPPAVDCTKLTNTLKPNSSIVFSGGCATATITP